jgi:hypothetical protein
MHNENAVKYISNGIKQTDETNSGKHQITIPSDWWFSKNSYDHLLPKTKPSLRIIKSPQIISVQETILPKIKGWDVNNGDYRVKVDEPERDFNKEKKQFKYKMFTAAIVLTIFTIWFVSMLVSKFAVMK